MHKLKHLIQSEEGASAVEYAVMLALIAGAIIVAVAFLGRETGTLYGTGDKVGKAISSGS